MTEIRSTIDIIMEQTKGMSLTAAEKDELHEKDLRKRAKGFILRMVKEPQRADEILVSLEAEEARDRELLEAFIWEEMVDTLSTAHDTSTHLDLLEKLPQAQHRTALIKEIRSFFKTDAKSRTTDKKKQISRAKKKLASWGVSGTAVVPKLIDADAPPEASLGRIERFKQMLREAPPAAE